MYHLYSLWQGPKLNKVNKISRYSDNCMHKYTFSTYETIKINIRLQMTCINTWKSSCMLCSDGYVLIIISIIILINTLSIVYIFIVVQWYKMIPLSFFNKLTKLGVNKQFKTQLLINCLYMLMDLQYLRHQVNILAGEK